MEEKDQVTLTVRLPREVYEAMRRSAEANDRSLNGEIVTACRRYGLQNGMMEITSKTWSGKGKK